MKQRNDGNGKSIIGRQGCNVPIDRHDEYFTALCVLAGLETPVEHCGFYELMSQLYHIEFIWSVPNDDNRALDALKLRETYCKKGTTLDDDCCSLLEMLLALAQRCDDELMYNPIDGNRSSTWFWMMLTNLGLNKFRDRSFEEAWNANDVTGITDIFMDREYNSHGIGGIFPLKGKCKDQTEIELWYQMNTYLMENPDLE